MKTEREIRKRLRDLRYRMKKLVVICGKKKANPLWGIMLAQVAEE